MANKQTLPNQAGISARPNYITTQGAPQMPSLGYKSPLRQVAGVLNDVNQFNEQYTKLKYEGYEAQGTKLMVDMAHEMEDASDPQQLQEIKNRYDEQLNNVGGDDYMAKNYRNSRYFTNFKNKWDLNSEKAYLNRMHSFEAIQAEKNGVEIANTISQLKNPDDIEQGIRAYKNSLDGIEHMGVEQKYKLMNSMLSSTMGNVVANNPDTAEAFIKKYGEAWGKEGLNTSDVLVKAENRKKALAATARAEQSHYNTMMNNARKSKIAQMKAQIIKNPENADVILSEAATIDDEVFVTLNDWNDKRKGKTKDENELLKGMSEAASQGADVYENFLNENFADIAISSKARSARDDLNKQFGLNYDYSSDDMKLIYSNADKGLITPIGDLKGDSPSVLKARQAVATKVAEDNYKKKLAEITSEIYDSLPDADRQAEYVNELTELNLDGKHSPEQEIQGVMNQISNNKNAQYRNAKNKLFDFMGAPLVGNTYSAYEMEQRNAALREATDVANDKGRPLSEQELREIASKYKPTKASLNQQRDTKDTAYYNLLSENESLFTQKYKDEKNKSLGKTYTLNPKSKFTDLDNYKDRLEQAKDFLSTKQYNELYKPIALYMGDIVKRAQSDSSIEAYAMQSLLRQKYGNRIDDASAIYNDYQKVMEIIEENADRTKDTAYYFGTTKNDVDKAVQQLFKNSQQIQGNGVRN